MSEGQGLGPNRGVPVGHFNGTVISGGGPHTPRGWSTGQAAPLMPSLKNQVPCPLSPCPLGPLATTPLPRDLTSFQDRRLIGIQVSECGLGSLGWCKGRGEGRESPGLLAGGGARGGTAMGLAVSRSGL